MGERSVKLLGVGIYSRAEVGRLLRLSSGRVSSWVRGYRYARGPKERRRRGEAIGIPMPRSSWSSGGWAGGDSAAR